MKPSRNKIQFILIAAIIGISVLLATLIISHGKAKTEGDGKEPAKAEQTDGKGKKGDSAKAPHGGKLFSKGDLSVEVLLAEDGGESRFRIFLARNGKPLVSDGAKAQIMLTRPDGSKQDVGFAADKDVLKSTVAIAEPHVFDAAVNAQVGKETLTFNFTKEEGKIDLADDQLKQSGISVQVAGAARIQNVLRLPGEIRFNQDRTTQVVPRVAGVVTGVYVSLGQRVKKGEVLATVASVSLSDLRSELLASQRRNTLARTTYMREKKLWEEKISAKQDYLQADQALRESEIAVQNAQQKLAALGASPSAAGGLNSFDIRAPFAGIVTEKHIALGQSIKEDASVFVVSDLSTVWAEIIVSAKDLNAVRVGSAATVLAAAFDSKATGTVSYVGQLLGEQTRTAQARVTLTNPQLVWRPGMFVNVDIVTGTSDAAVAVTSEALQSVNDKPTIFTKIPGGFIAQPVVIGLTDGKMTEIVKGLRPGVQYAGTGSFVLKAELGKSSLESN